MIDLNAPRDHQNDYMLISDLCIAVPAGWREIARCPAGFYFARPGFSRADLLRAIEARAVKSGAREVNSQAGVSH